MIAGYTVTQIKVGDIVRIWAGDKPHFGVVLMDQYPDEKTVYVSIITSSYCYTKQVIEITPEEFPPLNRKSMCSLEFKPFPRESMLKNWVGRLEDRAFVTKLTTAWFAELNSMRAAQTKQLAQLSK